MYDEATSTQPLTEDQADARARQLIHEAYLSHVPAPPVAQPGRPPMSQRATDASALMLTGSVAALSVGGGTALVLWQLASMDPVVLAVAAAAPVGFIGALGIAARMIGRAVQDGASALPPGEVHHHHTGPTLVQHTQVHTESRWLGRTTNQIQR